MAAFLNKSIGSGLNCASNVSKPGTVKKSKVKSAKIHLTYFFGIKTI